MLEYRIKVSVLGYRHRSSEVGGLLENSCLCASIVHSLLLLLSPLCFNCASIVLLLCVRFCAHIAAAAQRAGPSRCCHSVPHQCRLLLMHSLQFTRFTYFSCNHCHRTFMKRKNLKYRKKTYHCTIIVSPATVAIRLLELKFHLKRKRSHA